MLTIPKLMEPLQIALAIPVLQTPSALVCGFPQPVVVIHRFINITC
jgi:hypothetical protein